MIHMQHKKTILSHDYEVIREGMSMGTFRIIISKNEGGKYNYIVLYGGEVIMSGIADTGRRIEAMRLAKHMLFNKVRYGHE